MDVIVDVVVIAHVIVDANANVDAHVDAPQAGFSSLAAHARQHRDNPLQQRLAEFAETCAFPFGSFLVICIVTARNSIEHR